MEADSARWLVDDLAEDGGRPMSNGSDSSGRTLAVAADFFVSPNQQPAQESLEERIWLSNHARASAGLPPSEAELEEEQLYIPPPVPQPPESRDFTPPFPRRPPGFQQGLPLDIESQNQGQEQYHYQNQNQDQDEYECSSQSDFTSKAGSCFLPPAGIDMPYGAPQRDWRILVWRHDHWLTFFDEHGASLAHPHHRSRRLSMYEDAAPFGQHRKKIETWLDYFGLLEYVSQEPRYAVQQPQRTFCEQQPWEEEDDDGIVEDGQPATNDGAMPLSEPDQATTTAA